MPENYIKSIGALEKVPNGEEYLNIISKSHTALEKGNYRYQNFPELSYYAWLFLNKLTKKSG